MPRIVSVWLPRWPIARFLQQQAQRPSDDAPPIDARLPFALADSRDTASIFAVNRTAAREGIAPGMRLADARARIGFLQVRVHDPAADAEALASLAQWATRYTPSVAPFGDADGADGLFLDITGAAHLLGGEDKLLADLARRLGSFRLEARLACAETPGTAWALSRFAPTPETIAAAGEEARVLAPLPIEALRLDGDTATALRRLGFKRVGALTGRARAPFAARFEKLLLRRLDQALGAAAEPLPLLAPAPVYLVRHTLLEPIFTADAIVALTHTLMQKAALDLERDGAGARTLRLSLYRVDGRVAEIELGLALPTRSPDHVARLLRLKLDRATDEMDAGFGFETLHLAVTLAEPLSAEQADMGDTAKSAQDSLRLAPLLDALRHRLGSESVSRIEARARHIPEQSEAKMPAAPRAAPWPVPRGRRPVLVLPRPEPAHVIALVPDGPPQRLRWRGRLHAIVHAEGPERIAAEWWHAQSADAVSAGETRDYYLAEDATGRRLWLYREGIPGRETATPRWFVQGLFA